MYLYEGKGAYTIAKELKERGIEIKRTRSRKKINRLERRYNIRYFAKC